MVPKKGKELGKLAYCIHTARQICPTVTIQHNLKTTIRPLITTTYLLLASTKYGHSQVVTKCREDMANPHNY